jgi:hypothetical protein
MITQSGNNTKTDQTVAFIGFMLFPVTIAIVLIGAAVEWIASLPQ